MLFWRRVLGSRKRISRVRKMRLLVVGPKGAGKSTLLAALQNKTLSKLPKTQMVECSGMFIDTPGEYLEFPRLHQALIVAAQQADLIIWVAPADHGFQPPPGFALSLWRPVIGVITKIDVEGADTCQARRQLAEAGVIPPYFLISSRTGEGLAELRAYLAGLSKGR